MIFDLYSSTLTQRSYSNFVVTAFVVFCVVTQFVSWGLVFDSAGQVRPCRMFCCSWGPKFDGEVEPGFCLVESGRMIKEKAETRISSLGPYQEIANA